MKTWNAGGTVPFLVIGNSAADLAFTLSAPVPTDGKVAADAFDAHPGGQAANVAATLALLGQGVRFLGAFGGDANGEASRKALRDLGVDTSLSPTVAGYAHPVACILTSGGGRSVISHKDPRLAVSPETVTESLVGGVRAVYTDGFEVPASLEAARLARRLGKTVFADMEAFLPGSLELAGLADCLIAPCGIIREMGENDDLGLALAHVVSMGRLKVAVATCGARGAWGIERGGSAFMVPAHPCRVADSTGAGDAYHAGYMAAWAGGADVEGAMRFAARLAAAKCGVAGARLTPAHMPGPDQPSTSFR